MALARQTFDHDSPGVPTLTKGMLIGASGVSAPPIQSIGSMSALSSADGSFSDVTGLGHLASDSAGRLYACDRNNNRWQRFTKNASGVYVYDSKLASSAALGSSVVADLLAIDLARDEIHLGSSAQIVSGTLVGVWALSLWPSLTTLNRTRSYGTSSGSNGSGNLRTPQTLTVIGDEAYLSSSAGDYRCIRYNHTTGAVLAQDTNSLWQSKFVGDGTTLFAGSQATNTELGLWRFNPSTLQGIARLDNSTPAGAHYTRRNNLVQGAGGDIADLEIYNGRIYVRVLTDGRILSWSATTPWAFVDEFLWPGGAGAAEVYGHAPGRMFSGQVQLSKIGKVLGTASQSDDLILWSGNAQNTAQHSFLTAIPMSTSTATWTKTDWSAGTNTLKALSVKGTALAGEKYKVRLRKNSGSWVTVTADLLQDEATLLSVGTFTSGDTLTVELSLSVWDRLDGHASLIATRDKLAPVNVALQLVYEDTVGDVYVPYASAEAEGEIEAEGELVGEIET